MQNFESSSFMIGEHIANLMGKWKKEVYMYVAVMKINQSA